MNRSKKAGIAVLILLAVPATTTHGVAAQTANPQSASSIQPKVTGLEGNL